MIFRKETEIKFDLQGLEQEIGSETKCIKVNSRLARVVERRRGLGDAKEKRVVVRGAQRPRDSREEIRGVETGGIRRSSFGEFRGLSRGSILERLG